jgi:hypothetical protein
MFHVPQHCGRCGHLVDFRFRNVWQVAMRPIVSEPVPASRVARAIASDNLGPDVKGAAVAFCPRCYLPSLIDFTTKERYLDGIIGNLASEEGLMGGPDLVKVTAVYPPEAKPDEDQDWPSDIAPIFRDAQKMLSQQMTPSLIISACRSVLDMATAQLLQGTPEKVLMRRIERLHADGVITKPIADWAHQIRIDGNESVHEGRGEVEDARVYVQFLKIFLNVAFSLPMAIDRKKNP